MINKNKELISAIPDSCVDYNPDKSKPEKVRSEKSGTLFECKNFKARVDGLTGCLFCEKLVSQK